MRTIGMTRKVLLVLLFVFALFSMTGFAGESKWALSDTKIYSDMNTGAPVLSVICTQKEVLTVKVNDAWSKAYSVEAASWGYVQNQFLMDTASNQLPLPKYIDNTTRSQIIRVGDSRIAQMYDSVSEKDRNKSSWICKGGADYNWLMSCAVPQLDALPDLSGKVILIQLGINDIVYTGTKPAIQNYTLFYNTKAKEWISRGAVVIYDQIWPVDTAVIINNIPKNLLAGDFKEEDNFLTVFNSSMSQYIPAEIYKTSFLEACQGGLLTAPVITDGVHYSSQSYQSIYNAEALLFASMKKLNK